MPSYSTTPVCALSFGSKAASAVLQSTSLDGLLTSLGTVGDFLDSTPIGTLTTGVELVYDFGQAFGWWGGGSSFHGNAAASQSGKNVPSFASAVSNTPLADPDAVRIQQFSAAPINYASKYPSYKGLFCTGDALAAKGLSIGLDVVGAIPGLGNMVSAGAAGARAVDAVVTWGGGVLGAATSLDDPVGAASSGAGLGLALANVTIQSAKVIPGIGNGISALTGVYDAIGAYKAYQGCMASSKYD